MVTLEPWGRGDLSLLERLMGDPHMTEHLGGPESPDKLQERQGRYERLQGGDRMFKIIDVASGTGVGSVGFWSKKWRGEQIYEIGWMVVPEAQGRGIAVAATAQAIGLAKRDAKHRFMHAFPNVENEAVERDLPQARLRAAADVRVRVPERPLHDLSRLAPGLARLHRTHLSGTVVRRLSSGSACGAPGVVVSGGVAEFVFGGSTDPGGKRPVVGFGPTADLVE